MVCNHKWYIILNRRFVNWQKNKYCAQCRLIYEQLSSNFLNRISKVVGYPLTGISRKLFSQYIFLNPWWYNPLIIFKNFSNFKWTPIQWNSIPICRTFFKIPVEIKWGKTTTSFPSMSIFYIDRRLYSELLFDLLFLITFR